MKDIDRFKVESVPGIWNSISPIEIHCSIYLDYLPDYLSVSYDYVLIDTLLQARALSGSNVFIIASVSLSVIRKE